MGGVPEDEGGVSLFEASILTYFPFLNAKQVGK